MAKLVAISTPKDADDLLTVLGDPGMFQVIQFILLTLQLVPIAMSDIVPLFFNIRPTGILVSRDHLPRNLTGTSSQTETVFVNASGACDFAEMVAPNFSYIYPGKQWSIVADMDLLCDKAWLADLATTIYFLGQLIGSLVSGWTADAHGRRKTLLASNVGFTVFSTALIFSRDYVSFVVLRFLIGFFSEGMYSSFNVLMMEWLQPKRRGGGAAVAQFFWSLGVLILALAGYWLQNWHYIQIVLAVANITALGHVYFAPESLKWLLLHNKVPEALQTCERVAKFNKVALPPDFARDLELIARIQQTDNRGPSSFWDCFKTRNVRIFTALCSSVWLVTFFSYYGFSYLMATMSGSIYLNMVISECLEAIPRALCVVLAQKFTNRATLMIYFSLAGIFAILSGIVPLGDGSGPSRVAKTSLAMIGRMAIVGCFAMLGVITSELFPTVIRNRGFGWCSLVAKGAAMAAPQLLVLSTATSFTGLPYVVMGAVCVIGSTVTLILPETTGMKMMATIDEAETFGTRELLAFYRRKSVAVLTFLKPGAPRLRMRRNTMHKSESQDTLAF